MQVRLTKEQKIQVSNSTDIYDIMLKILMRENKLGRDKEHFWIVCLAADNRILLIELISLGTINAAYVNPTEVFSFALQKRASKIILVHNHPSGLLEPGEEDKDITDRMIQVGQIVNLPVIDHLIISEQGFYSFAHTKLLDRLKLSKKYAIPYREYEKGKEEGLVLGKKEGLEEGLKHGEKYGKVEVAEIMKKSGDSIEKIMQCTGLSIEEIEEL